MKIAVISASLALALHSWQADADESRRCTAPVLKLPAGCLNAMAQNFSPKDPGINYCPIPKKKEIPTS